MSQEAVSYQSHERVATITVERPDKRNALNAAVVRELEAAWHRFNRSDDRAAVLTARGDQAFSVGADLEDVPKDMWRCVPGVGVDVSKPIVAATAGWCVGGGFILVQMSDLCVAAESTKFLYPEARIGLTGGLIASLAARIPHKVALEFMLLGAPMDAARAYEIGLVNRVVANGQHLTEATAMARTLAESAPLVVEGLKRFVGELIARSPVEIMCAARRTLDPINQSEDFAEGVAAFRGKRKPRFVGK